MKKFIELIKEKWGEYVIEILVITLGIFGAFILNNWNESRKQNERFKIFTEQLYTAVDKDLDFYINQEIYYDQQINFIRDILDNNIKVKDEILIMYLFWLDSYHINFQSESKLLLNFMDLNEENEKQNQIFREVSSYLANNVYTEMVDRLFKSDDLPITNFLVSKGFIKLNFFLNLYNQVENSKFSYEDLIKYYGFEGLIKTDEIRSLIKNVKFKNQLRSVLNKKNLAKDLMKNAKRSCKSIQDLLLNYNPKIKLIYSSMEIVGDALPSGFDKSVSMERDNRKIGFWKIKTKLKQGNLKFINRNDWLQNWGGNSFPDGKSMFDGVDIYVNEGYYNIVLDLENKIYSFEKLDSIK